MEKFMAAEGLEFMTRMLIHARPKVIECCGRKGNKDNLRHLPRFPDFFVTFRILSRAGIEVGFADAQGLSIWIKKPLPRKETTHPPYLSRGKEGISVQTQSLTT